MSRRLAAIDAETTPSTRIRVTGAFVKVMLMSDRWQYFRCVDRLSHGLEGPTACSWINMGCLENRITESRKISAEKNGLYSKNPRRPDLGGSLKLLSEHHPTYRWHHCHVQASRPVSAPAAPTSRILPSDTQWCSAVASGNKHLL